MRQHTRGHKITTKSPLANQANVRAQGSDRRALLVSRVPKATGGEAGW